MVEFVQIKCQVQFQLAGVHLICIIDNYTFVQLFPFQSLLLLRLHKTFQKQLLKLVRMNINNAILVAKVKVDFYIKN